MPHPAADIVQSAVQELRAVGLNDGGNGDDVQTLDEFSARAFRHAFVLLTEAQEHLQGSGTDRDAVVEAMKRVRDASYAIESTRGLVRWMPQEVVYARADVLRLLDRLTGRW